MKKLISLIIISLFLFQSCENETIEIIQNDKKKPSKIDWGLTEWNGTVPDACKEVCLVAGQHMYVGTVNVATDNGDLLITYNITEDGIYLEEVHLDIFSSLEQFKAAKKVSNGGAIPGKFEYKMSWSADEMITSHTVRIPKDYVDYIGGDCLFVASHAALSNGETAWGGLCDISDNNITNLDDAKQFPGANWSVYFEFCAEECTESIDFTYAWEDLQNIGNDADYNDLVIQSDIIKSNNEVKITFLATARGAAFDHRFKFKIPKTGITGIFGAFNVVDDGTHYIVTVFQSTKVELPGEGISPHPYAANTVPGDVTCAPNGTAEIVLTIDSNFSFNPNFPYEPFINVTPFAPFGTNPYDLYIYEVSGRDTWIDGSGDEYPNGILISSDWKWPLEAVYIGLAYPDFKSLTDGWNPNWSNNLADLSKVFDTDTCN